MLPCRPNCSNYRCGCHRSCAYWKGFQARQDLQRHAKKRYLQYYNALYTEVERQYRGMGSLPSAR